MSTPLLELQALTKQFGGTRAVDAVSLTVHSGEILALLGENGAGKSTLIKMLAGVYPRDAGTVLFAGKPWQPGGDGVAFIHQDPGLIEWMTVAENMGLGAGFPHRAGWLRPLVDWTALDALTRSALERVGCVLHPRRRVFTLSRTEKSLLAIARALRVQARLLVLDEPTASLPAADVARLFGVLRDLRAEGVAMIYVSHRLDEVMALCDRAAVLRDGRLVGVEPVAELDEARLVEMIVGHAVLAQRTPDTTVPPAAHADLPRLAVQGLQAGTVGPIHFTAHAGEILGLVGLRGGGQETVSRTLFGAFPQSGGNIALDGKNCAITTPAAAIAAGIGLVAADRMEENLARGMTVQENLFLHPALRQGALSRLDRTEEAAAARRWVERLDIRPAAPHAQIEDLSGGNQQKVILGRWLNQGCRVLILEEPTAGVDIGARAAIHEQLRQAAAAGLTVLVVSTDFEEVAQVCSRALVFAQGRIVAELSGAERTTGALLHCAAGTVEPKEQAA